MLRFFGKFLLALLLVSLLFIFPQRIGMDGEIVIERSNLVKFIHSQDKQTTIVATHIEAIVATEVDTYDRIIMYPVDITTTNDNMYRIGEYSTADRAQTAMDMLAMWLAADAPGKNYFYMPEDGEHLDRIVVEG